jgi:undecaprenyl-diphosphatase
MSEKANANKGSIKRNHLILLIVGVLVLWLLFVFDIAIWQAARDLVEPDYLYTPELFSDYGLYLFYLIFGTVLVYALARKNSNLISFGLAYVKTQLIISLVLVWLLKVILGRPRPGNGFEFSFFATSYKYNAFPSGHSADAFVSGVFLFYLLNQSKFAGYRYLPLIYAFLIAVSRVFVSSHYPSDVAAGMAIGILGAWVFISRDQRQSL